MLRRAIGLGLLVGFTGCTNLDDDTPDDQLAFELAMGGGVTFSSGTMSLGTHGTCFLSGIKGNLVEDAPYLKEVYVQWESGGWHTWASDGLTGVVTCIAQDWQLLDPNNEEMDPFFQDEGGDSWVTTEPHRRCMLNYVAASDGFKRAAGEPMPRMGISAVGSNWSWSGSVVHRDFVAPWHDAEARAACVDVPDSNHAWGIPVSGTSGVKTTTTLKDADGNPIATAGTECALSEVSGRWDLSDPVFGSTGAGITLSNTGTNWTVTTIGDRAARISCWR